jgi:hypothetical protein
MEIADKILTTALITRSICLAISSPFGRFRIFAAQAREAWEAAVLQIPGKPDSNFYPL